MTACSGSQPVQPISLTVAIDCSWYLDQTISQPTRDWLHESATPAPEPVVAWLMQAGMPPLVEDWLMPRLDGAPLSADAELKRIADNTEKGLLFCPPPLKRDGAAVSAPES